MWLPNDHTAGTRAGRLTPAAYIATNDYAVGLIVAAISHSKVWPSSAIFITEDDAQDGADHVSDQRTTLYIASPYAKGGAGARALLDRERAAHHGAAFRDAAALELRRDAPCRSTPPFARLRISRRSTRFRRRSVSRRETQRSPTEPRSPRGSTSAGPMPSHPAS